MLLSLIGGLALAGAIGLAAGWRWHGSRPALLLTDMLQGVIGGLLAMTAYVLTGPVKEGAVELVLVAVIGTWVWLGAAHLTVSILNRIGPRRSE